MSTRKFIARKSIPLILMLGLVLLMHHWRKSNLTQSESAMAPAGLEAPDAMPRSMKQPSNNKSGSRHLIRTQPINPHRPDDTLHEADIPSTFSLEELRAKLQYDHLSYDEGLKYLMQWQDGEQVFAVKFELENAAATSDEKLLLFMTYLRVENYDAALELADQESLLFTSSRSEVLDAYGDLMQMKQRYPEAEKAYRKALALHDPDANGADRKSIIEMKLKQVHRRPEGLE